MYLQEPFPHCLLVNHFPQDDLLAVSGEIDVALGKKDIWKVKNDDVSKKFGTPRLEEIGPNTSSLWNRLSSQGFIDFLSNLTGISGLEADPTRKGGGVHAIGRGGFLKIHADFNYHQDLKKYRRVNLLLYLNDGWLPEYGGNLELWDGEVKNCVASYPPLMNHCVIFTSSDYSFHGHPTPLACPEGIYRKSIAAYYYTDDKPDDVATEFHSTLYRDTK